MTALGYRKRSVYNFGKIDPAISAKVKHQMNENKIRKLEYYLNTYCFVMFMCRCECKALTEDMPEAFSKKELRYFDYVKDCIKQVEYVDALIDTCMRDIFELVGTEDIDHATNILYEMFVLIKPLHRAYQNENTRSLCEVYNIKDKDAMSIVSITRCAIISRLLKIANEVSEKAYNEYYTEHPNIDYIINQKQLKTITNAIHSILSTLCKHFLKTNELVVTEPTRQLHLRYIATICDKELFNMALKHAS